MPMLKRPIEPSSITRATEGQIPKSISNELEFVANSTQANLIRQLSSLSQHAEDMFRELFVEATAIFDRTCSLTNKVEALRESVQQFDPNQVVVKLTDITKRKPFKTEYHTDQQICTKSTMPRSLQDMYSQCAPPPRLDKFDKFRTDGKSSVKMYTNPDYFVQLWVESIQKNVSETTKKHDGKKVKKRPSKRAGKKDLTNVASRAEKYKHKQMGEEFVPAKSPEQVAAEKQAEMQRQQQEQRRQSAVGNGHIPGYRRDSQQNANLHPAPPPPPPAPVQQQYGGDQKADGYQEMIYDYGMNRPDDPRVSASILPPPPPSSSHSSHLSRASTVSSSPSMQRMTVPPPPPPPALSAGDSLPPPPSPPEIGIVPPPPSMMNSDMNAIRPASPPPPLDTRQVFIPPGVPPPPAPLSPRATPNTASAGVPPPPPPPPPPPGPGVPGAPSLPPPPPAPAAAGMIGGGAAAGTSAAALSQAAAGLKSTANLPKPEPVKDERSDLLEQIRLGIQLRGAEERKQHENTDKKDIGGAAGMFDVQSIMDRVNEMRRHMENSDSDDSDYEDWDDSDDD